MDGFNRKNRLNGFSLFRMVRPEAYHVLYKVFEENGVFIILSLTILVM